MEKTKHPITIIGSGNVATHFALALFKAGHPICEVYSKTAKNAELLAEKVNAKPVSELQQLSNHNGIYLLSVSDSAYEKLANDFPYPNKTLVHTAGSVSMEILSKATSNYGVLYPFQTLSKSKEVDFRQVPLLYCANNQQLEQTIQEIGISIAENVSFADDHQRKMLHICAVFACNFANHMFAVAEDLAKSNNIDFSLLYPLLKETLDKAMVQSPKAGQTGPAVRNDQNILKAHMQLLKDRPDLQSLYQTISNSILKTHHNGTEEL